MTLPLYPGSHPCIRSGYCCKQSPCAFGEWDTEQKQCRFLQKDNQDRYQCGIYEQIIQQAGWEWNPAFGAGCCSPMNSDRAQIKKTKENYVQD